MWVLVILLAIGTSKYVRFVKNMEMKISRQGESNQVASGIVPERMGPGICAVVFVFTRMFFLFEVFTERLLKFSNYLHFKL